MSATKKFLMKNFVIVGAVATLAMFTNNLVLSPENDMKEMISHVKKQEGLNEVEIDFKNNYKIMSSTAHMTLGKEQSKKASISQSPYTTFFTKAFAPIEFAQTDSKLFSKFIVLHELAHTELNYIMYNNKQPLNVKIEGVSDEINKGISNYIATGFLKQKKSMLYTNYHENFADSYGAILAIKHLSPEYSDKDIKQVIQARYSQVYNQANLLWGGMGDNVHKTEHALKKVLDTPMDKIRAMSKEESQNFAIQIASASTVEQFPQIYAKLLNNVEGAIPENQKIAFSKLKVDKSFMDKVNEHQNTILSQNVPEKNNTNKNKI